MPVDLIGHRLYRRTDTTVLSRGSDGAFGRVGYESQLRCGFYPTASLPMLDANLLSNVAPVGIDGSTAVALRNAYYNHDQVALYGEWTYLCAIFEVPVYVPPEIAADPIISTAATDGWDAGAVSAASFFQNGRVKFRVQPGKRFSVGMQEGPNATRTDAQHYGFYIQEDGYFDNARYYDSGSILGAMTAGSYAPFTESTIFSIEKLRDTVTYKAGGVTLASNVYGAGFLLPTVFSLGAAIFSPGTWVEGLEVYGFSGGDTRLPALRGRAGVGAPKSGGITVLPALTGTGRVASRATSTLPALKARGGDYDLAEGYGALPALAGSGTAFASLGGPPRSRGRLAALKGSGHSLVGTVGRSDGELPAIIGRGGRPISESYGHLAPLRCYAGDYPRDEARFWSIGGAAPTLRPYTEIAVVMGSRGGVASAWGLSLVVDGSMSTSAGMLDSATLSAVLAAVMNTEVLVSAEPPLYEQANEVWVVSLSETAATSTFEDYPFNSFGVIGGRAFGAKQDGVFLLEGDDDAGAAIRGSVSYGKQDFGTKTVKHMTRAYAGVSSKGTMFLKIVTEGKEYIYAARGSSPELQQQRFDVGRGLAGNYFTFELFNKNGGDFEIDSVSFFAAEFKRRI